MAARHDSFFDTQFITGANYWASHAGTQMWSKWDAGVLRDDLAALRGNGIVMLRVFPLWSDFQPIRCLYNGEGERVEYRMGEEEMPETPAGQAGVSEVMLARFRQLADLAGENGMRLVVALVTGHMTSRLYMPEGLAGLNPVSDPDALLWQMRFVRLFVSELKDHPAIAAWELGNECNVMGKAHSPTAASAWMMMIANTIRASDPSRPVISGMDGTEVANGKWVPHRWTVQMQAENCDILATHHYTMWKSSMTDPLDTIKATLYPVAENRMYSDISGRPCFMEEIGTWRPMLGDFANHSAYIRSLCWNLWTSRGRGLLWWCAFDQDNLRIAPFEWDSPGLEHGLFDRARKPHPTAESVHSFRKFIDALPFAHLPAATCDAVCLLGDSRQPNTEVGAAVFILSRQAGLELEYQNARQPLKDAPLYLLPSACGKAGMSGENWRLLREKVHAGAVAYLSLDDVYLDHFAEFFGAAVQSRYAGEGSLSFEVTLPEDGGKFVFPAKTRYLLRSCGAEVVGRNADGEPVMFCHRHGKGKVFLLGLPVERLMMQTPLAFHNPETCGLWRIYRHLRNESGARVRLMESKDPFVTTSEHYFDAKKCAVVIFNHAAQEKAVTVEINQNWRPEQIIAPDNPLSATDSGLTGRMCAQSGALILLHQRD